MDKRLIPIIFVTFTNALGYSIIIPIAPFIVEDFGGGPLAYGLALSIYALCQYIAAPFMGSLSDRFGRKPLLIISHTGTLFSWLIFLGALVVPQYQILGFSLSLLVLLFARLVDGLTGGNISVASAYVSDICPHSKLTTVYGYISAAYGLGFTLGPILGSLTSNIGLGYAGTGYAAILISLITLYTLLFMLPETNGRIHQIQTSINSLRSELRRITKYLFAFVKYSDNKKIQDLIYERIIFAFIFALFTSILSLHLKDYFDMNSNGIGVIFLIIGFFLALNQGFIVPFLSKKYSDEKLLNIAMALLIVFSPFIPFVENELLFLIVTYFLVMGFALNFSALKALLIKNTPRDQQGEISGIDDSMFAINQAIVPLFATFIYVGFGSHVFIFASVPLIAFVVFRAISKQVT